jgi:hypothetical protein
MLRPFPGDDIDAQAVAAYDSPAYQAALAALGNGAERDLRIVKASTVGHECRGSPLPAAVVDRGYRCGLCREGQHRAKARVHLRG